MTIEERLAAIVRALEAVSLSCLVMGGHAVRHYGLQRFTNDFDLSLSPGGWDDLANRLARTGLFAGGAPVEGNSWRPGAFRRFQIGVLPDGREEWLEFWRENHLLAPFEELFARRETGSYGNLIIPFLGLSDLLRSKETERAKDWDDVAYLEECHDARLRAGCLAGNTKLAAALAGLRSRRGFDAYLADGRFDDRDVVRSAIGDATNPITQAFLIPFAPDAAEAGLVPPIEPLVAQKLRSVAPASSIHRSLVEVVRRRYKVYCQARDRADKEAVIKSQRDSKP